MRQFITPNIMIEEASPFMVCSAVKNTLELNCN